MRNLILPILAAVLATLATLHIAKPSGTAAEAAPQTTAYQRLLTTGTLKCGYNYWEPGIIKNDDGTLRGYVVDVINEVAKTGDFEVEWVGPIGWGNVAEELASGKIDMMCAGMWQSGLKAKRMVFSHPFSYEGVGAFIRKDEKRFTKLEDLNQPSVTLATIDSDNSAFIAKDNFPQAKILALPMGASDAELALAVSTGKADATFVSEGLAADFTKKNPGKITQLQPGTRLRLFGHTFVANAGEFQLIHFFETTLAELTNAGTIGHIIDKYPTYPFIKPAGVIQ